MLAFFILCGGIMSGVKAEWSKWPIPDDWDEAVDGYMLVALCIPNSRTWRGIFRGQIADLAYGRHWNRFSGQISDVQVIARQIYEDMSMTCLDDVVAALNCICDRLDKIEQKTQGTGNDIDGPPSDGTVQVGPEEQFPTQEVYFMAKCNASNAIFDTIHGLAGWLDTNQTGWLGGVLGGIASALTLGAKKAGIVGWAVVVVSAAVEELYTLFTGSSLSTEDVVDALDDRHDECVKSLYNAENVTTARDNFVYEIAQSSVGTTTDDRLMLSILLSNELLNELFNPRDDTARYESANPVVCDTFLQRWQFISSGQGWSFRDDSTGSYSANGAWNSDAEAWRINLVGPGTGTGPRAEGKILITGLSIVVDVGNSIQFDHSATSDGVIAGRNVRAIFSDLSEQSFVAASTKTAGTVIMSIEASKVIEEIEIGLGRNWSSPFNITRDINEVRVV